MVMNETLMKITAVILVMVGIAGLASTDANNPMTEIGIPVNQDSFNVFALAAQAPQITPLAPPEFETNETKKYCWISWFCPDLPFSDVALAIHHFTITVANVFIFIANAVLQIGTVLVLMVTNFLTLFNFASWAVFQTHILLLFFGIGLTSLLGGTVALWVFEKVRTSIPGIG